MTSRLTRPQTVLVTALLVLGVGSGWDGASCSVEHPPTPAEVTQ